MGLGMWNRISDNVVIVVVVMSLWRDSSPRRNNFNMNNKRQRRQQQQQQGAPRKTRRLRPSWKKRLLPIVCVGLVLFFSIENPSSDPRTATTTTSSSTLSSPLVLYLVDGSSFSSSIPNNHPNTIRNLHPAPPSALFSQQQQQQQPPPHPTHHTHPRHAVPRRNEQQQQQQHSSNGVGLGGVDGTAFLTNNIATATTIDAFEQQQQQGAHPKAHQQQQKSLAPPRPPATLPLRFLRAGKNDPAVGLQRYEATLRWRKDHGVDTILRHSHVDFAVIKQHYPHYFHLRGRHNEPCFYDRPAKTNLPALRAAGVDLPKLLHHYTLITEFLWQYLERDDLARSIYIIDLDGIRMRDFFGETVDFVKKAAGFSAQHYPERAGTVFVINVPSWFKLIWQVVRPIIDEGTLKKIFILRGADEIRQNLLQRIPLENIPLEYGGTGLALGQAPEETLLANLMEHNNGLAWHRQAVCEGCRADIKPEHWACPFCRWTPARSY